MMLSCHSYVGVLKLNVQNTHIIQQSLTGGWKTVLQKKTTNISHCNTPSSIMPKTSSSVSNSPLSSPPSHSYMSVARSYTNRSQEPKIKGGIQHTARTHGRGSPSICLPYKHSPKNKARVRLFQLPSEAKAKYLLDIRRYCLFNLMLCPILQRTTPSNPHS